VKHPRIDGNPAEDVCDFAVHAVCTTYITSGIPVTSRKDWMTTQNRLVTLGETGDSWERPATWTFTGLATLCVVPAREPTNLSLRHNKKRYTLRVFREGGSMKDHNGQNKGQLHG
jgi:hypothetical protein